MPYLLKKEMSCPDGSPVPEVHGLAEYCLSISTDIKYRWARAICACGAVTTVNGTGTYAELLHAAQLAMKCGF